MVALVFLCGALFCSVQVASYSTGVTLAINRSPEVVVFLLVQYVLPLTVDSRRLFFFFWFYLCFSSIRCVLDTLLSASFSWVPSIILRRCHDYIAISFVVPALFLSLSSKLSCLVVSDTCCNVWFILPIFLLGLLFCVFLLSSSTLSCHHNSWSGGLMINIGFGTLLICNLRRFR